MSGKWNRYVFVGFFLLIGIGALVVALVPPLTDWVSENFDTCTQTAPDGRCTGTRPNTPGKVRATSFVLGAVFISVGGLSLLFWGRRSGGAGAAAGIAGTGAQAINLSGQDLSGLPEEKKAELRKLGIDPDAL